MGTRLGTTSAHAHLGQGAFGDLPSLGYVRQVACVSVQRGMPRERLDLLSRVPTGSATDTCRLVQAPRTGGVRRPHAPHPTATPPHRWGARSVPSNAPTKKDNTRETRLKRRPAVDFGSSSCGLTARESFKGLAFLSERSE